jgi:hypothetical protein
MTYSSIKILESLVKNELEKRFPYVRIKVSTLGGETKATIFFTFSLDKQNAWDNGIMENSRYFIFSITYKGEVECVTSSVKEVATRKFTEENSEKCLTKIIKMLDGIKAKTSKKVCA